MANTVTGGIIDIEHCADTAATTPTYTKVGETRGTVSWAPNVEMAESGSHGSLQQDKAAVSEAWALAFEAKILSTLGGMETLGLYDSTAGEFAGHVDVAAADNQAFRISVYEDQAAKDAGTTTIQIETADYICLLEEWALEEDDFSHWSAAVHSRTRPSVTA